MTTHRRNRPHTRRRVFLTAALAAALLLAGCSSFAGNAGEEPGIGLPQVRDGSMYGPDTSPPFSEESEVDLDTSGNLISADARRVIRTARVELNAADTRAAYTEIGAIVESAGGFIARADVGRVDSEDSQPAISMTLRVPSDRLTEILTEIKAVADKVVTESQDSADVSDQFVDLEARLTNLEALETELRALLEEVRLQPDADPEKLLRVFNELASVRGQVEQIEGQLQHLSALADLATVEVSLTQTPRTAPIVETPWTPSETVRDAARQLVLASQTLANGLITFAVLWLPILLVAVVVPLGIGWVIARRLRKTSSTRTPSPE